MKKFVFASVAVLALVGFVTADEFTAQIMKVEGNTVTFKKGGGFGGGGKKGGKADPAEQPKEEKADVTSDVKVLKGEFDFGGAGGKKGGGAGKKADPGAKKGAGGIAVKEGDALEGGLKNEVFTKIDDKKGVFAQITTNDAGKITKIVTITFGKKGGIE
ncbi:MAG TPA: hypothetical protein VE988_02335 [Gemmataceae bacterium]|nr:hypothetical protein [Gemmataceae bacterium]